MAVHIFNFPTALAEATAVAKTAHTVCADPAGATKLLLGGIVAFVATKTVPTVVYVAVIAQTALGATLQLFVAGTALVTVGEQAALRAGTIDTARATHTAAVFVPMVMVAEPAVHTIFVGSVNVNRYSRHYSAYHNDREKHAQNAFQNVIFHFLLLSNC